MLADIVYNRAVIRDAVAALKTEQMLRFGWAIRRLKLSRDGPYCRVRLTDVGTAHAMARGRS